MASTVGQLRHRIQLQSRVSIANNYGERVPSGWTTYATVWARVEPVGGGEGIQAGRTVEERSYRVTIRHRSDVEGKHTILLSDGRRLQIDNVVNLDERGAYSEITATEVRGQN